MCGITGYSGFGNRTQAEAVVQKMNLAIAHRGPDADGIWSNDQVVLGHRRLSIIDTSAAGNQPFFSSDRKIVIVFNGEIYNYIELKKELESEFEFTTSTDTEVIIAVYRKWGISGIERLFGMFGFALWDEDLQELFIVRDRLGIKPIYFFEKEGSVLFASEIRAILQSGLVDRQISQEGLVDYLRYQTVHAPNTIVNGVKMLMPGNYMVVNNGQITTTEYWSPAKNASTHSRELSKLEAQKEIYNLMQSAVEIRMRADVDFGAFLSGGIDSSVIVGLMSRLSTNAVRTFSITFHEKEFDESPYSSMIAKRFNTAHEEIRLSANDFLRAMPDALNAMDHPSGDGPNTFVVSKVTRHAGVKMALSGLGGDEVFAGYDVFKRMKSIENRQWINAFPRALRALGGKALTQLKPSVSSSKIAESLSTEKMDFAHLYPLTRRIFLDSDIRSMLSQKALSNDPVFKIATDASHSHLDLLSQVSISEMQSYMQNVLLRDTDQMSMAHALEVRVPFLDHRLVEFVLGIGDDIKYPHSPKQLLVESMGDLIPREIVDRPKMGFTFPWAVWMKSELRPFCEENLALLDAHPFFERGQVMHRWNRFLQGDPQISWSRLWPLVVLGHWMKTNDVH